MMSSVLRRPVMLVILLSALLFPFAVRAETGDGAAKFKQLDEELPTPTMFRAATGEPGPNYWQQRADYQIKVTLDEKKKTIFGSETITYHNNAPHSLKYIWVQLDQNRFADGSISRLSETSSTAGQRWDPSGEGDTLSFSTLARQQALSDGDFGAKIDKVTGADGRALRFTIVDTLMRIDLPTPLAPNTQTSFSIDWHHQIINEEIIGGRGGYEWFRENDTYIYFLAQWYPRVAVFSDYEGWHTKPFLGRGEFTLEFGDFDVEITAPADHIVAATGVLRNPQDVLAPEQITRLEQARNSNIPVFIVTPEEALENEKTTTSQTKTWKFYANNVRDFSFASSRKFIWDAQGYNQAAQMGLDASDTQNHTVSPFVMAMSFYPNEAEPLWSKYSTASIIHTMKVYSRYAFPYPYPTSQSINTWDRGGMEYPMITFNGYRPVKDEKTGKKTYSRGTKYSLIGVIIHEVGHNYFPMTVNSDERQWTWMDEGLNSFLEYIAELEWEENYPAYRNDVNVLDYITSYMQSENQVPIMTNSESILQFGPNAYSKPTSALIVLRETVMGRELFDFAFKEYANRWKFKRPTPADFFRTMEDASGVDLDWFWRGWFFTTDHVDVAIRSVREYKISSQDPDIEYPLSRLEEAERKPEPLQQSRNREQNITPLIKSNRELQDFYNKHDRFTVTNKDRNDYKSFRDGLEDWEADALDRALAEDNFIYFIDFTNEGGLVTPLPLQLNYADGSVETMMIPAEIWRRDATNVTKLLILKKRLHSIDLDPHHQTADVDYSDNAFPPKVIKSRIELYKSDRKSRNLMADMMVELKGDDKETQDESTNVPLQ